MADKAGQPYSVGQTLTAATSAIIQSQRFPLAMREWHKLPPNARTWAAFKATLLEEQKHERDNGVASARLLRASFVVWAFAGSEVS